MWQSYFPPVSSGDDLFEAVTSERLSALQRTADDVSRGGQIRGMGGVRVRSYNGETTVAVERFRRRLWQGGGGESHEVSVNHLGGPGYRMVKCTESYAVSGSPP